MARRVVSAYTFSINYDTAFKLECQPCRYASAAISRSGLFTTPEGRLAEYSIGVL